MRRYAAPKCFPQNTRESCGAVPRYYLLERMWLFLTFAGRQKAPTHPLLPDFCRFFRATFCVTFCVIFWIIFSSIFGIDFDREPNAVFDTTKCGFLGVIFGVSFGVIFSIVFGVIFDVEKTGKSRPTHPLWPSTFAAREKSGITAPALN